MSPGLLKGFFLKATPFLPRVTHFLNYFRCCCCCGVCCFSCFCCVCVCVCVCFVGFYFIEDENLHFFFKVHINIYNEYQPGSEQVQTQILNLILSMKSCLLNSSSATIFKVLQSRSKLIKMYTVQLKTISVDFMLD